MYGWEMEPKSPFSRDEIEDRIECLLEKRDDLKEKLKNTFGKSLDSNMKIDYMGAALEEVERLREKR